MRLPPAHGRSARARWGRGCAPDGCERAAPCRGTRAARCQCRASPFRTSFWKCIVRPTGTTGRWSRGRAARAPREQPLCGRTARTPAPGCVPPGRSWRPRRAGPGHRQRSSHRCARARRETRGRPRTPQTRDIPGRTGTHAPTQPDTHAGQRSACPERHKCAKRHRNRAWNRKEKQRWLLRMVNAERQLLFFYIYLMTAKV